MSIGGNQEYQRIYMAQAKTAESFIDSMNSGFLIYEDGGLFVVHKIATPKDPREIPTQKFPSRLEAVLFEIEQMKNFAQQHKKFTAIIRYDRGLGVEYRNLDEFDAQDVADAKQVAQGLADSLLGRTATIKEIRVKQSG